MSISFAPVVTALGVPNSRGVESFGQTPRQGVMPEIIFLQAET